MSDRRTSERLLVPAESLERIDPYQPDAQRETEETQPMRLSFLALLADRDPAVQARLERRRTLALEDDLDELQDDENDRPTDPMVMVGR
jgi:hypothetical protein